MANLYISEYEDMRKDGRGHVAQVPLEPSLTTQKVSFAAVTSSATFQDDTAIVLLHADANCHVAFGVTATATVSSRKLIADTDYYVGVKKGQLVSVYDGAS